MMNYEMKDLMTPLEIILSIAVIGVSVLLILVFKRVSRNRCGRWNSYLLIKCHPHPGSSHAAGAALLPKSRHLSNAISYNHT